MIKKHPIALFVNTGERQAPVWTRIQKSTALTLAMNPETEEVDYIADESPTEELVKYKPSIEQPLKMIKGEPDFEYFWDKFFAMDTGNEAKTDYLIVFYFDKIEGEEQPTYKAWNGECTISFNELNAVDSELNFDLMFGGTVLRGLATVANGVPTFAEGTEAVADGE